MAEAAMWGCKWSAQIVFKTRHKKLGTFDTQWEAGAAHAWAFEALHGTDEANTHRREGTRAAALAGVVLPLRPGLAPGPGPWPGTWQLPVEPRWRLPPTQGPGGAGAAWRPARPPPPPATPRRGAGPEPNDPRPGAEEEEEQEKGREERRDGPEPPVPLSDLKLNIADVPRHVRPIPRRNYDPDGHGRTAGQKRRGHFLGTCFRKGKPGAGQSDRWQSRIKKKNLGNFETEYKAGLMYAWAYEILHGRQAVRRARREGERAAKEAGVELPRGPPRPKPPESKSLTKLEGDKADSGAESTEPEEDDDADGLLTLSDLPKLSIADLPPHIRPLPHRRKVRGTLLTRFRGVRILRADPGKGRRTDRYTASIVLGKEKKVIGTFDTEYEAGAMFAWAFELLHGRDAAERQRGLAEDAARRAAAAGLLGHSPEWSDEEAPAGEKEPGVDPESAEEGGRAGFERGLSGMRFANLPGHIRPFPLRDFSPCKVRKHGGIYRGAHGFLSKSRVTEGQVRWRAHIRAEGKSLCLGTYDTDYQAGSMHAWAFSLLNGTERARIELHKGEAAAMAAGIPLPWEPEELPPELYAKIRNESAEAEASRARRRTAA